jgi:hypothetical protein
MSVLDLFAAALGAFILISVILFPNYMKQQQVALKLDSANAAVNQCESAKSAQTRAVAACEASRDGTFLVVSIEWSAQGAFDIDLHVIDPQGHEFFWAKNNRARTDYPSTDAQLSYDNTRGPGMELWQHPKAVPGVYKIAYYYYGAPDRNAPPPPIEVKGHVFYRHGRLELPAVTLSEQYVGRPVAELLVGQGGTVEMKAAAK